MRLFGKKFIPGVRVEVEDENNKKVKDFDIVSNHSEQSTATTYEPNSEETNECDEEYDEDNYETTIESFEAFTSMYSRVPNIHPCVLIIFGKKVTLCGHFRDLCV